MGAEAKKYLQEHSIPQLFEVSFLKMKIFIQQKVLLFICLLCAGGICQEKILLFDGSNYS